MSAPVPRLLGGAGCGLAELSQLCSTLAHGCGSSAMVLAMHYIQVACIVRHAQDSEFFQDYLRELVREQWLLASMTMYLAPASTIWRCASAMVRKSGVVREEAVLPEPVS